MTNREYFNQKKKAFRNKFNNWFDKHLNFICLFCVMLDVLLFIIALKVDYAILVLFFLWTFFCFNFIHVIFELWLDNEHKEKE